jgi:methylphosphotriester-DNA--protein-cysteine methyltransferase
MLTLVDSEHFELAGHIFRIPTYENAEEVVNDMVSQGVLRNDTVVQSMLQGTPKASSQRSLQRHFKTTTGLSRKKLADIRRAQDAVRRLKEGDTPADAAANAGYYDQPHLTKSLKRLMDSSPTDVDDVNQV